MCSPTFLKEPVRRLAFGGLRGIYLRQPLRPGHRDTDFPGATVESSGSTLEAAPKAFRNNSRSGLF
jgi:hypothetical protein